MPGKGINGRANMQKFQGNSKKFGGNPFKFASLVSSTGRVGRGGMWNYIQRRADTTANETSSQSCSGSAPIPETGSTIPEVLEAFEGFKAIIEFDKDLYALAPTADPPTLNQFSLIGGPLGPGSFPTSVEVNGEGKLILDFNGWEGDWPPEHLGITYTNSGLNTLKNKICPSVIVDDFVNFEVYNKEWSLHSVLNSGQMFGRSSIEAVGDNIYIAFNWAADIYAKGALHELHFVYSNNGGQTWSTPEVIDDGSHSGGTANTLMTGNNSIAVHNNKVYVCYIKSIDPNNPDVMWAYNNDVTTPGSWETLIRLTHDASLGIDPAPSIAVHPTTGTLFISYYNQNTPGGTNGCLQTQRSTDEGLSWPEPPNPILADGGGVNGTPGNGNTGQHSSITTAQGSSDNKNYVYICYHSRTLPNNQIMVVRSDDDGLTYTSPRNISLTNAQDTALYPSIYVTDIVNDDTGKVYVSYNYVTTSSDYEIWVASWINNAVAGGAGPQKTQITGAEGPSHESPGAGVATAVAASIDGSIVYVSYGYQPPQATERPLYLAISPDGGANWNPLEVIDSTPGGPVGPATVLYTPSMNMIRDSENIVISYPGPGDALGDGFDVKMAKYS